MKKRWFLTALFALTLCACVTPAQAAVVSGGTEYVWYTDMGRGEYNENNEYVSREGQQLYLSADQGGSYAVLPGLGDAQKKTGLSYVITVQPNAANDGGLSVKGRDIWSTEYTWFRDYSAQEIAAALKNTTKVTPVRVHATNGTVTVGSRYVMDEGNDDPTQPGTLGTNLLTGAYAGDRIVYSTDGVTWLPAEGEGELNWLGTIWWDGEAFHSTHGGTSHSGFSADGIHWAETAEELADPTFSLACELGPYRFEYAENAAGEAGVYLMDHTSPDTGVLLPHMMEAAKAKGVGIGKLRAWYGPNDTVILAAYDVYGNENLMVSINYPISSLDWCLENLKTQFRTIEPVVSDGAMALGVVDWDFRLGWRGSAESRLACNDGSGWKWAENIFSGKAAEPICCAGGYFWVQGKDHHLYRSADGHTWLLSDALRPTDQKSGSETYLKYQIAGTESGFIVGRHGGVYQHGMMGHAGGGWYEGYSKVYFLDREFHLTGSYDFGRLVEAVGYLDGVYYAKVANSEGGRNGWTYYDEDGKEHEPKVFDPSLGSALYRSSDGVNWEKTDIIQVRECLRDLGA